MRLWCDRDMAGRWIGGVIMHDALAATGIDRCGDVDERRGGEHLGEAHVLRLVCVRVAQAVMDVEQVAVAVAGRDGTGTGDLIEVKQTWPCRRAPNANAPDVPRPLQRHDLAWGRGIGLVEQQQLDLGSMGRVDAERQPVRGHLRPQARIGRDHTDHVIQGACRHRRHQGGDHASDRDPEQVHRHLHPHRQQMTQSKVD